MDIKGYQREAFAIVLSGVLIFFLMAVISYNPCDASWFYYAMHQSSITNWAGRVGACVAALFFFLFGFGTYVFLGLLSYIVWSLFVGSSLWQVVQRSIPMVMLVISTATLCAAFPYSYDAYDAGGFVGGNMYFGLLPIFGPVGVLIVVAMVTLASIPMLLQKPCYPLLVFFFRGTYACLRSIFSCVIRCVTLPFRWIFMRYTTWKITRRAASNIDPASTESPTFVAEPSTFLAAREEPQHEEHVVSSARNWADYPIRQASAPRKMLQGYVYRLGNTVLTCNVWAKEVTAGMSIYQKIELISSMQTEGYALPSTSIFSVDTKVAQEREKTLQSMHQEAAQRKTLLEEKLEHFGVKGLVQSIKTGPLITLFEYQPSMTSKISKITALEDDLAMALTATSIRIVAPIPGKNAVGFEIANNVRQSIYFSDVTSHQSFVNSSAQLPLVFGVDVAGEPVIHDLIRMPHLLVGGATGSGKSVGLNAMLAGLLSVRTPDQMKMILVDPKRLEFTPYADIPHLLFPIITDPGRAGAVLKWVCHEMECRYQKMAEEGVRNIQEYHARKDAQSMPFLVVVIDELADLMMVAGKEVEGSLVRIAQMARASGIHMIVATQRPSVDVVTGLIKVNFPSRMAFRVSSKIDSRTILDGQGAEKLLGRGDLLFMSSSSSDLIRMHGAYVSDREIHKLTSWWRAQSAPSYLDIQEAIAQTQRREQSVVEDDLYPAILEFVKTNDEVSISMIQRSFRIGFNRSARLIEKLEMDGIIAPAQGSKPRKVIR